MDRSNDLRDILRHWEYDEDNNVRFITGDDGRDVMQIRQPLGIEQYDLDGRPDGLKAEGAADWLDFYSRKRGAGTDPLDDQDFQRLHEEGVLYYQRYLALFQVGQYDRVDRDTRHNLDICEILERRYPSDNRYEILQYRPYILRMNAISRAMLRLAENDSGGALEELTVGRTGIDALPPVPTPIFEFEKIRSLQHLTQVISQVREDLEGSREKGDSDFPGFKERLADELGRAVDDEDYERAARLRDRLRDLD